jgi:hypothetical protein
MENVIVWRRKEIEYFMIKMFLICNILNKIFSRENRDVKVQLVYPALKVIPVNKELRVKKEIEVKRAIKVQPEKKVLLATKEQPVQLV